MTSLATFSSNGLGVPHGAGAVSGFGGAHSGSDLCPGAPEMIVCARHRNPPLRFKGCVLSRHWLQTSSGETLKVDLYQRLKGNFVLSYSVASRGQIASDAVQMADINAASLHLENTCAKLDAPHFGAQQGALPWAEAHFYLCFGQYFAVLIADVLDDWQSLFTLKE